MLKKVISNRYDCWIYPLYIAISCTFTAGLNIIHTKYILGVEPFPELFIVPTIAGIIFGFLAARIRLSAYRVASQGNWQIFIKYILLSCLVTSGLNVVHTEWILGNTLSSELFIAPIIAGVFFGYLLARINTLNSKLLRLATTDMLTQLCNRMQFDNYLNQEIEKVRRHGGTFSVIYFDLDNFKQINDEYGHQMGDEVLAVFADHVKKAIRKSDILARYGGDEFIILAPDTKLEYAQKQAEILCQSIECLTYKNIPALSCSFGVAEFNEDQYNHSSLINSVDRALYDAKNSGKSCVAATTI